MDLSRKNCPSLRTGRFFRLFILHPASARAAFRVWAADAFGAVFLLTPKVEAYCADDGGNDEDHDYIS